MRSLQNRSLLEVNEDFGGKRNDKRAFLVNLLRILSITSAVLYVVAIKIKQTRRFPALAVKNIEILNLWEDFKKVVKFIDDNFEWLNPLMEHITHKKLSLE